MYNNDPRYMNPQQGLASLVNSPYGDSDVMQVKMTPNEVAGLQQLAMSYGANEQDLYDPVTGQPRFNFLKKLLPTIIGAVLPGVPVLGDLAKTVGFGNQAIGSALLVGGVTGLIEGDLKKGLMAGLGAYSGAKIGEGFTAAGKVAGQVATQAPPTATVDRFADDFNVSPEIRELYTPPPAPVATTPPTQAADVVKTVTPRQEPTGFFGTMGQGAKNLFASDATGNAARQAFGETFSNPFSRYATMFGVANALTPEQKPLSVPGMGEDVVYIPGGFNPQYGTGADQPPQLQGRYYKRTAKGLVPYNPYQMAPGYAQGGAIDATEEGPLPRQDVMPYPQPNQSYPLSTVVRANYSPAMPRPREVIGGYGPKMDPFTGEEKFADGGEVGVAASKDTKAQMAEDPNVIANRKYVEELNRRALNPVINPYGLNYAGGLGGTNTPWTGTNPYGGPLTPPATGGQTSTGGGAGDVAAFLATQVGMNWMMQPGNALALKNWITGGMKWADRPFLNADKTGTGTGTGTGTNTGTGGQQTQTGGDQTQTGGDQTQTGQQTQTGTDTTTTTTTGTGTGTDTFDPNVDYSKYTNVGGDLSKLSALMKARSGLESLGTLGGLTSTGFGSVLPATITSTGVTGLQSLSSGMAPSGSIASQYGGMKGALEAGAKTGTAAQSGLSTLQNKIIPGVATAVGAYNTAKAIEAGKEGRAAFNAASTALSAAKLGAPLGPAGMLAAAAIAAIGASLVNTKEYGDVALRNYWNAVDAGRNIGQTDPNELAQGFINFYRTNKNEFAGQEKYGRTGNEDFVYDMTQVINNAVKDGKVNKDVDPVTMYKDVVQPWLNSMGSGPKDEKARAIQDFMMTDLINSFMQGKPISNAQVKGDKKFKIVSEKPVYAGAAPTTQQTQQTQSAGQGFDPQQLAEYMQAQNPFGQTMQFADGGAIGDDYNFGFAMGGMPEYKAGGKLLNGPGDGMSDSIPAVIRGKGEQRAALADGEFVVPADVVSHLGNGSTKAGAKKLYSMMDKVRQARTGSKRQAPAVKSDRLLPA